MPDNQPFDLEAIFADLRDRWKTETGHFSTLQQKILHPAYQEIIGLGTPAIPLLLAEMKAGGRHWFWALRHIARHNPVSVDASFDQAVAAWDAWWEAQPHHAGVH